MRRKAACKRITEDGGKGVRRTRREKRKEGGGKGGRKGARREKGEMVYQPKHIRC
jgi:hypothetical protein